MADFNASGLCHVIGKVRGYKAGYRDLENKLPITENTLYNIYSNTKVISCVAAMQLYEQGAFLLEDPLFRFFPEFEHMKVRMPDGSVEDAKNPVTIRDLFRMTSGFGDGNDYQEMGMQFYTETGGACPVENAAFTGKADFTDGNERSGKL